MIRRFRAAVSNAMSKKDSPDGDTVSDSSDSSSECASRDRLYPGRPEKYKYARPYFLSLTKEEVQSATDFGMRPILTPRDKRNIPWNAGYAECINGGKSDFNEDNSYACSLRLKQALELEASKNAKTPTYTSPVYPDNNTSRTSEMVEIASGSMGSEVYASYYGIFDGHAGYSTSLITSKLLHVHIQDQLRACLDVLLQKQAGALDKEHEAHNISTDSLVVGALEEAFAEMDCQLERESSSYLIRGGCTALVVLLLNGKMYVANAGDCRAVLCHGDSVDQLSRDFTPASERQRINYVGYCHPELLHNEFTATEFARRVNRCDIGQQILCRKPGQTGWAYKQVDEDDLKFPLIIGDGKKARIMGTIGVSRGLGDHDLFVYDSPIWIKPFLSSIPEVTIRDLREGDWSEEDVVILGSDGLWDTITNTEAVDIVRRTLKEKSDENETNRYIIAAQELVLEARGLFTGRGWRKKTDETRPGSFDDITAFVIPLKPYAEKSKVSGNVFEAT